MNSGAKRFLLAAILVAAVVSHFAASFNRYYLGLAIDVGISIILAVSLNLINGHTGQFSLGHAGFMAVGGYAAAAFTIALSPLLPPAALPFLFLLALLLGGLRMNGSGCNLQRRKQIQSPMALVGALEAAHNFPVVRFHIAGGSLQCLNTGFFIDRNDHGIFRRI